MMTEEERKRSLANSSLKHYYGITLTDFEAMNESCGGKCQICGKSEPNRRCERLSVDHDHQTGQVRGLLCSSCNTKLGWFEKNSDKITAYLEGANEKTI